MFFGIILVAAGLTLAYSPLGAARFANRLRMVPYRDDADSLSTYRVAGFVIAILGLAIALLLR